MEVNVASKKKPDPVQLDTEAVGQRLGITAGSVRRYRLTDREQYGFPEPDGRIGRSPWWWSTTIDEWVAVRPGAGAGAGRPKKAPARKTRKAKP